MTPESAKRLVVRVLKVRGWNDNDLAHALGGIHPATVYRWRTGKVTNLHPRNRRALEQLAQPPSSNGSQGEG